MRNISVELLRPGSFDNMLLNPVTQYVGVCGNHPPVTFNVDLKHRELIECIRALRYEIREDGRPVRFQIDYLKEKISGVLKNIRGIDLELETMSAGDIHGGCEADEWLNLRLVINAKELALLPFEIADSFNSIANIPLSVNTNYRTILTREVRKGYAPRIKWPRKPKILFAAASPPGAVPVPISEHLKALRSALEPWAEPEEDENGRLVKDWKKMLSILPNANLYDLQKQCEMEEYTHVHILAHGEALSHDDGYGIRLWDKQGLEAEVVTGEQLITAMKVRNRNGKTNTPAVVTLAVCDSGNSGSAVMPGAGIAHTMNEAGVPFVLASQFPLTMAGSVSMAWEFYYDILWGKDPRKATFRVRQTLYNNFQPAHDWGSIVAYSNLPDDFDEKNSQLDKEVDRLRVLNRWISKHFGRMKRDRKIGRENVARIDGFLKDMKRSRDDVLKLYKDYETRRFNKQNTKLKSDMEWVIGSAYKRVADVDTAFLWLENDLKKAGATGELPDTRWQRAKKYMLKSRDWYEKSFLTQSNNYGAMVQFLFVSMYLELLRRMMEKKTKLMKNTYEDVWNWCRLICTEEQKDPDRENGWLSFSIAELDLIRPLLNYISGRNGNAVTDRDSIMSSIITGIKSSENDSDRIKNARIQFRRHREWWTLMRDTFHVGKRTPLGKVLAEISAVAEECCLKMESSYENTNREETPAG